MHISGIHINIHVHPRYEVMDILASNNVAAVRTCELLRNCCRRTQSRAFSCLELPFLLPRLDRLLCARLALPDVDGLKQPPFLSEPHPHGSPHCDDMLGWWFVLCVFSGLMIFGLMPPRAVCSAACRSSLLQGPEEDHYLGTAPAKPEPGGSKARPSQALQDAEGCRGGQGPEESAEAL